MVRGFPNLYETPGEGWGSWHGQYSKAGIQAAMVTIHASQGRGLGEGGEGEGLSHIHTRFPLICTNSHRSHSLGIFYGENPLDSTFLLILLQIVVLICTTSIIRFLLKPLRQPRVISEMIGGIIIGPSILGRNKKYMEKMLPYDAQFVVRNIGTMAFMYFLFIAGVKMDLTLLRRSGKKHVYIAVGGVIIPTIAATAVAFLHRGSMDRELGKVSSIGAITTSLAITSFPVLGPILKDLNLLSSEMGRMAIATAIIGDAIGINIVIAFEAIKQGEGDSMDSVWYLISLVILLGFIFTAVRRTMIWIVHQTPVGKPVSQGYIVGILLGVMMMGFLTDMFGMAIANGPLWLGIVIPDGPPLGATLVERTETIVMEFLMPFAFALVGLYTDVYAMFEFGWSSLVPVFAMIMTGYVTKLLGTLIPSLLLKMPFRDSLTLSLMMSLRGQVELLLYIHWIDKVIIGLPAFTLLVLSTVIITGIAAPLISYLYDPTRPYMVNKRRTIQHHPPDTELRVVVCVHEQESVSGLINLLEASYPTLNSPFAIYSLHLIELVGRGIPLLIDYEDEDEHSPEYTLDDAIHNALKHYSENRGELKFSAFTALAPIRSMYQNICELALVNKATLIILPFHKEYPNNLQGTQILLRGVQSVNLKVLSHAPCSVGVLVDKGDFRNHSSIAPPGNAMQSYPIHHFVVLFLGGADAREALAYADRMVGNLDVSMTVIRFLSFNHEGDDEMEKKLDDGVVTWFWVKNESNERVRYREVVVRNGAETVASIQAVNEEAYCDLWIVGRHQGINQKLLEGLEAWREDNELGVIGDYVGSIDFSRTSSVLVIQQQVLRGQNRPVLPWNQKFSFNTSIFNMIL